MYKQGHRYISTRLDANIPQSFIFKTLPKYIVTVALQAQISKGSLTVTTALHI
jgi:hypothetical protein